MRPRDGAAMNNDGRNDAVQERMMNRRALLRTSSLIALSALLISAVPHHPTAAQGGANLSGLEFLIGEWEGVGDQAGATGGFTFAHSLQDHVIVRTNYSVTPASNGHPASRHDDWMIFYVENGTMRADYYDSEGHVIRYSVTVKPNEAVFVSDVKSSEPRYRLSYTMTSPAMLSGAFEVAPPGKPDAFSPYLSWSARKVK